MEPTHKPIIDYFQSLNEKLKDFGTDSFFRQDLSELRGAIRSGISYPALAVESPDGDGEKSIIQNSVIQRHFAFTVYLQPEPGNFQEQNEMLDRSEKIGLKILSRMRYDARVPGNLLYNKFKASSVRWMKVGPIYTDMLYGYRFTGVIEGDESLVVDPADWSDLEPKA